MPTLISEVEEINQLIAEFLPLKDILSLALVSKDFHELIKSNTFWNRYLKSESRVYDENQPNLAYKIFRDEPQARTQYPYIGKAGQEYLEQCMKKAIKNNRLNKQQQSYLRLNHVVQQITQGKLTIELAIEHSKLLTDNNEMAVRRTTRGFFGTKKTSPQHFYKVINEIQPTPQPDVKPRTRRRI